MGSFKEAMPVPDGWTPLAWELAYNCADSRMYRSARGARVTAQEKRLVATRARASGQTRALALTLASEYTGKGKSATATAPLASRSQSASESLQVDQYTPAARMIDNEFTYPLTTAEFLRVSDIFATDVDAAEAKIRPLIATCRAECKSVLAKCRKHKLQYLELLKEPFLSTADGRWVAYRPASYAVELLKMFNDKVDVKFIEERLKKEVRRHNKDSLCTPRFDDDAFIKQWKLEAIAMYNDERVHQETISKFIREKNDEWFARKSPDEQEYLRAVKGSIRTGDTKMLPIVRKHVCSPRASDSERMAEIRAKWANLIDQGLVTWISLYNIMNKDVADIQKAEIEQEEIRFAQIALEKEKVRKAAAKQERLAKKVEKDAARKALLYATYSGVCAGCQNIAVPDAVTGSVLRCQVCKGMVARGLQENESYYCSRTCATENGRKHMEDKHPCTAAADCVNTRRHGFEVFSQYCLGCWDRWGIVSYICNCSCYDKNWANHWTQTHPRLEKEFEERKARAQTESEAQTKGAAEHDEKGRGKQVAAAPADADADADTEDHEMADAHRSVGPDRNGDHDHDGDDHTMTDA